MDNKDEYDTIEDFKLYLKDNLLKLFRENEEIVLKSINSVDNNLLIKYISGKKLLNIMQNIVINNLYPYFLENLNLNISYNNKNLEEILSYYKKGIILSALLISTLDATFRYYNKKISEKEYYSKIMFGLDYIKSLCITMGNILIENYMKFKRYLLENYISSNNIRYDVIEYSTLLYEISKHTIEYLIVYSTVYNMIIKDSKEDVDEFLNNITEKYNISPENAIKEIYNNIIGYLNSEIYNINGFDNKNIFIKFLNHIKRDIKDIYSELSDNEIDLKEKLLFYYNFISDIL
ncbi:hypothetical protein YN1_8360 [Nanoarchaeota archaeon]